MSTHTPGPWHTEHPYGEEGVYISAKSTALVAKLYPVDTHVWVADKKLSIDKNAQLIAAAPELLEQLKLAHRMLLQTNWIHEDEAMNELLAVIRKAEGI